MQREAGGCEDGWHGPVVQRTRPAPRRGFGSLEVAAATAPAPVRGGFNNMEGSRSPAHWKDPQSELASRSQYSASSPPLSVLSIANIQAKVGRH